MLRIAVRRVAATPFGSVRCGTAPSWSGGTVPRAAVPVPARSSCAVWLGSTSDASAASGRPSPGKSSGSGRDDDAAKPAEPGDNKEKKKLPAASAARVRLREKRKLERVSKWKDAESRPLLRVTLVGRPNVGKSTLFNRLTRESGTRAIVHSTPGVTRDRREARGGLGDLEFEVVDTAGLEEAYGDLEADRLTKKAARARKRRRHGKHEPADDGTEKEMPTTHHGMPLSPDLQRTILRQTEKALRESDVVLFMLDGREGVTAADEHFARWIRKECGGSNARVVVVVNKCEDDDVIDDGSGDVASNRPGLWDAHRLGLGDPVPISAQVVQGFDDLYEAISSAAAASSSSSSSVPTAAAAADGSQPETIPEEEGGAEVSGDDDKSEAIRVAVVGRPNVGKSTLVNSLLGTERMVTGPQPGLTRDSIAVRWQDPRYPELAFELVDTAGLKGTSVGQHARFSKVDQIAMAGSLRSIEHADVVLLMVDASLGLARHMELRPMPVRGGGGVGAPERRRRGEEEDQGQDQDEDQDQEDRQQQRRRPGRRQGQDSDPEQDLPVPSLPVDARPDPGLGGAIETACMFVAGLITGDDLRIADKVIREGRPLMIVPNKWDLLTPRERQYVELGLRATFEKQMFMVRGLPVVPVSALSEKRVDLVTPAVVDLYQKWNKRVKTHTLNQFLEHLTKYQPPPRVEGTAIKLRYMTQKNVRPPTFTVTCSRADVLPASYRTFVGNSIRKEFGLEGIPMRLSFVKGAPNPYLGRNRNRPRPRARK